MTMRKGSGSATRKRTLAMLAAAAALPLGGCVAGMAVGAASAVGQAAAGDGPRAAPGVDVAAGARAQCSERAAPLGAVHIIDIEERGPGRAIVWGTAGEGPQRRS
ncbi:MAG: hypothetical protein JO010_10760, partial [Alphaproteobacteria bacterium]|nr:hypothetical protein [Alphaproteobacteria bacterium]